MNLPKPFSFKKIDASEEKEYLESQKQAELAFTAAGDRARKCLATDDFKMYREEYRRTEAKVIDAILKYNNYFHKNASGDISNYAMVISRYLTRLESLRSLLEAVTKEAQKGLRNESK